MNRSAVFAGLAVLMLGGGAHAQQSYTIPLVVDFEDERYTPFYELVERQLNAEIVDGRLVAEPDAEPGNCSISGSALESDGVRATYVDVQVEVTSERDDEALMVGAGLFLRHSNQIGLRFLALLATDEGYDIVAFDNGTVGQRIRGTLVGYESGTTLRLAAREAGGGAEFFINGNQVGSISDSRIDGRGVGLLHCASGRYVFDDWGLNTRGDIGEGIADGDAGVAAEASPAASAPPPLPTVGAPPPLPTAEWYVEDNGAPVGPLTLDALRARIADGRSTEGNLVWRDGMADWAPAREALP